MFTPGQIAVWFGIGAARMRLRVDQEEVPRGSRVTGTVTLTGAIVPHEVSRVTLKLRALPASQNIAPTVLREQRLVGSFFLAPRSIHVFPFRFEVPYEGALYGCDLSGVSEFRRNSGPTCRAVLRITRCREATAVWSAMEILGFERFVPVWQFGDLPHEGERRHYRPPEELRESWDDVIVTVQPRCDRTTLYITLCPHDTGLRGRVGMISPYGRVHQTTDIPSHTLIGEAGEVQRWGALGPLKELLAIMRDPKRLKAGHLLRPAQAPADQTLLRPAADKRGQAPKDLLRPSDKET